MKKAKLAIFSGIFIIASAFFIIHAALAQSTGTSDAIGVRIIPNPNHYSVYRWYDSQGFSGSPQALSVDGYEAVRDGRTVYVNAANVKGKSIYTNIYLISYNQDPSPNTIDILGQIIKNWKFNNDLVESSNPGPQCLISALPCNSQKDCSEAQICATSGIASSSCQLKTPVNCLSDNDCPDNFFCSSIKAKIIRDINRIGKTEELKDALYAYKSAHGYYPRLSAGSYLSGYSTSVWPSWQNTFLPALSTAQNIVDPINRLGACAGYDMRTCWNETTKRFVYSPTATYLPLPGGSYGFVYKTDANGSDYDLCAVMETREQTALLGFQFAPNNPTVSNCVTMTGIISDGTAPNTAPILVESNLIGEADQEFNGSIRVSDGQNNPLTWTLDTNNDVWPNWSAAPTLKDTSNINQKKVYALRAGGPRTYNTYLQVSDGQGGVLNTLLPLTIINPKPSVEAEDGVYTLNPQVPFSYSFYFSDAALATIPSAAYTLSKVSGPSNFDMLSLQRSVATVGTNRYLVTYHGTIATSSKFLADTDFLYHLTVRDKYNDATTKDFKITLKIEAPTLNFNCPSASRLTQSYTCLIGDTKQGDHTINYTSANLPAGLTLTSSSPNTTTGNRTISLSGTTNTLGSFAVNILGTNEYGATSSRAFNLKVNSYCGDGLKQSPNSEGRGGIYNDGYEDCDGSAGVSVVSGRPVVSTDPTIQYGCSTYSSGTPYPITNNNYCIFKSAIDGGGYCGDGYCQSRINYNGTEYSLENSANCLADCDPTCVPSCVGSVCGSDGCGGTCGTCDTGKCVHGACLDIPLGCSSCGNSRCDNGETEVSCPFDCTYGACLKDSEKLSADQLCEIPISPGNCDSVHCIWQTNHCVPKFPSPSVEACNALTTEDSCSGPIYGCIWDPTAHRNYLWCGDGECTSANGENANCCTQDCGAPADTAKPIVMTFNIPATSATLTIPILAFTASDNTAVIGYALTETALAPAPNSSAWKKIAPTSYTFATTGTKTLYAWAMDEADNVSSSMSRQITVTVATAGNPIRIINHSYPRIGAFQWGGGTADWFSKFDLIVVGGLKSSSTTDSDARVMAETRLKNPDAYILATRDWNAGGPFYAPNPTAPSYPSEQIPPAWRLRSSTGTYLLVYGLHYFVDISNYCGRYTGVVNGFQINNETYAEALARSLVEKTDWTIFDGVSSDGSWPDLYSSYYPDVDLDRNGLNDRKEVGKGNAWVKQQWWLGQDHARDLLKNNYLQRFGNRDAKLNTWWTIGGAMSILYANGAGWENMFWNGGLSMWLPIISDWESRGPLPRINYASGDIFIDKGNAPTLTKAYYRLIRFTLGVALLNDDYYITGDLQNHHWSNYYDEFDVPLGQPKGSAHTLSNGGMIRCFDGGASIVNPTSASITVTAAQLQAYPECVGTYYRFKGNQDPVTNNGQIFNSITLISTVPSCINDSGNACTTVQNIGDGILLVKQANLVVVSDIIVDNSYASTSAGSDSATLSGFTVETSGQANNRMWSTTLDYAKDARYYPGYYAAGNSSAVTATATFTPKINIDGQYRLYEWHGWRGTSAAQYSEATNVPLTVNHADGIYTGTINQSTNYGQWNLIGTYNYNAGQNLALTITNRANGYVLADAFKWVYIGPKK